MFPIMIGIFSQASSLVVNSGILASTLGNDIIHIRSAYISEYSTAIQSLNPILYYELNEVLVSDPVTDTMGNYVGNYDNDTILQQASLINTNTTSILTNGTITSGFNTPSSVPQLGSLTIEFWIKITSTAYGHMMGRTDETGTKTSFVLYSFSNDCMFRLFAQDGSTSKILTAANTMYIDIPTHIVGTYDNTTKEINLYINSILGDSDILDGTINEQAGPITYGKGYLNGTLDNPIAATFDEAAIYDYVLTPTQILDHYILGSKRASLLSSTLENDIVHIITEVPIAGTLISTLNNDIVNITNITQIDPDFDASTGYTVPGVTVIDFDASTGYRVPTV